MRWWLACLVFLTACKQEEPPPEPPIDTAPIPPEPVSVRFEAWVDTRAFDCVSRFNNLGVNLRSSVTFQDLRFYVMNLGFVDATGNTTFVEFDADEWQSPTVALVDFADGSGFCEGTTPGTHTTLTGRVTPAPEGGYTSLVFTIGVPVELNHVDLELGTPAPLNLTDMFTGRLNGYRFFKLDLASEGEPDGYPLHIRSLGCRANDVGVFEGCSAPNRAVFTLPAFDPEQHVIRLDLATLLSRNDLDDNWPVGVSGSQTSPGCQSEATDEDCRRAFVSYGLSALPQEWITSADATSP